MEHSDEIKSLFKMYLEGKTDLVQNGVLFRYLRDHKDAESELSAVMEDIWQKEEMNTDDVTDPEAELDLIWTKINRNRQQKNNRIPLLKYAGALILLCSAALICYKLKPGRQHVVDPVALVSKTTGASEKIKMLLPDSSVVYVGSETKITWPEHFEPGHPRYISLEGEAFFDVKHDATRPFIIKSGKLETRVLGTSFNLYAYPADNTVTVTVRTGKVGVIENRNGIRTTLSLLSPGMRITYRNNDHNYWVSSVKATESDGWISNRFVFRDENLGDILFKLQRYYDVRFEIKNPALARCRFNATFFNQNIHGVMQQLSIMSSGHIKYRINNNKTVVLWGETCE
ncbi:ferric-dicitrate binding protein FerR (iron transport regulator) [Mucilaginibacter rubeus]|uniref:FecR family protein n=1 Tax=Mucilaginibacter rubeus TaxID=2027860 RepID=UPI0033994F25